MRWIGLAFLSAVHALCTGVAFRGGGSLGAVEIGMLSALQDAGNISSVDILTGISAGGLNAGFLASHMADGASFLDATTALGKLYASLTNDAIYQFHLFSIFSSWSLYQTSALNATIQKTLEPLSTSFPAPKTIIGTSNLQTGYLDVVEYDTLESVEEKVHLLMATSAIPLVFPPIAWKDSLYVDGGLISNELLVQAFRFLTCEDPLLWFFEPSIGISPVTSLPSFASYIHRILSLLTNGFDNQLQKILDRPACKSLQLQICSPNSDGREKLSAYNLLEFGYGAELFEIGYSTVSCESRALCI